MLIIALNQEPARIAERIELQDEEGLKSFEIRSVYCYTGSGDSGHYIAVVQAKGLWFTCDDSIIHQTKGIPKRAKAMARSLLYERVIVH